MANAQPKTFRLQRPAGAGGQAEPLDIVVMPVARNLPPLGELVELDDGAKARCILRARLMFDANGVLRVMGPSGRDAPMFDNGAEAMCNLILASEQATATAATHIDRLANRMGFDSYEALWAFVKQDGDRRRRIPKDVIGIGPVEARA